MSLGPSRALKCCKGKMIESCREHTTVMRLTGVLSEPHLPSVTHFIPTATSGKRVESSNLQTEKLWQEEGLLGPQLSPTDLYKESHG